MNIVIVGEYSAFSRHLKIGFNALGHNVCVITNGDFFKKIEYDNDDIHYNTHSDISVFGTTLKYTRLLYRMSDRKSLLRQLKKIKQVDLVIVINPSFVSTTLFYLGVPFSYISKWKSQGAKIILSCCGDDPAYNLYGYELKYFDKKFPLGAPFVPKSKHKRYIALLNIADIVVPTGYDYHYFVQRYCEERNIKVKITNTIPLPIKIEETSIISCTDRPIVIFHGVNREQDKGTAYFLCALDRIKEEFRDKVEIVIDGKMPYREYVELLRKTDILLDQTNSYGMGINAELGLMYGKVVFSGNEPENIIDIGLDNIPVINAIPDSDYLYRKIKELILNPSQIDQLKHISREFAVEHLSSEVVAAKYLSLINN